MWKKTKTENVNYSSNIVTLCVENTNCVSHSHTKKPPQITEFKNKLCDESICSFNFKDQSIVSCSHCGQMGLGWLRRGKRMWWRCYLESEQHGEELALVSDQHGVADDGHLGFQGVLDGHRRDVLTSRCDDQFWAKQTRKKRCKALACC